MYGQKEAAFAALAESLACSYEAESREAVEAGKVARGAAYRLACGWEDVPQSQEAEREAVRGARLFVQAAQEYEALAVALAEAAQAVRRAGASATRCASFVRLRSEGKS